MNEEIREAEEVLMLIKKATMFADPIMKIGTIGLVKLIQFMARMVKEKIIDKKEFKDIQDFIKRTDGNFDVINIPVDQKLRLGANAYPVREFENLKESGVRFMEMPDLNKEDHYVQLAVCKEDREIFDAWFGRYLGNKLSGGEKTIDSLLAFTERKTSIFSVPFEGKEDVFRADFDAMKINYTVMPDLKLGDGQVQIMVANYDTDKVRQWYELYQQSMLNRGETVADLNEIDMETYQKTAEMSTEEYINTGDDAVKEANQKYEDEKTSVEKVQLAEDKMDYDHYEGNQMYQKFTINKEVLVKPVEDKIPEGFQDFFVSKVPGTYGKETKYLVIPKGQVFASEDSKTYTAFFEKDKKPFLFDQNLRPIKSEKRPFAKELFEKYYSISEKEKMATQAAQQRMEKAIGKTVAKKQIKAPTPPIKAK